MTEVKDGCTSAGKLADRQDAGQLSPPLHVCVDARSVFDAIVAVPTAVPADKHLCLHVRKMREFVDNGIVNKIWWIDTLDMIADGMTKGVVPRDLLLHISAGLDWTLQGDTPCGYSAPQRARL